jgi:hypothetical protein
MSEGNATTTAFNAMKFIIYLRKELKNQNPTGVLDIIFWATVEPG